ncbi:sodium- and chloride-dependent glycine transporter 1-like [Ostrinia nubilalis]|uniref:sodium- and chloride-dependent glycine transporter 1-like n=1 Tax=Ostrinia nubilalis TaxID=29057 RepID=UPI0030825C76
MIQYYKVKQWIKWPLIRAHLCTLAVSVGFSSTWRAPREAFRFGGLQFALAASTAALLVLPLALLQLALGQLSQQDAVGIWRAVPFFKGVGYLRLLVTALGCVSSAVYLALTVAYFLYTLSNSIPFRACSDPRLNEDGFEDIINTTNCLNATFLAPVRQKPEYFIAMSLIICFIWIALPFLLYSPVKLMKRVFYILGPTLVVLGFVVVSGIGSWGRLTWFHEARHWRHFLEPRVWISALTQALLATHTAGGYLVSAGDAIYSVTNVQWTAIAFVATNIVAGWLGPLFWFALGAPEPDTSAAAVLEQIYRAAYERDLSIAWPLLVFAALFLSGVITMLTFLYPIYDRVRRSGGARWRVACAGGSAIGAAGSLAALAGRWDALALIEDTAVPLLVCLATVLEVLAFVFIYGK